MVLELVQIEKRRVVRFLYEIKCPSHESKYVKDFFDRIISDVGEIKTIRAVRNHQNVVRSVLCIQFKNKKKNKRYFLLFEEIPITENHYKYVDN